MPERPPLILEADLRNRCLKYLEAKARCDDARPYADPTRPTTDELDEYLDADTARRVAERHLGEGLFLWGGHAATYRLDDWLFCRDRHGDGFARYAPERTRQYPEAIVRQPSGRAEA